MGVHRAIREICKFDGKRSCAMRQDGSHATDPKRHLGHHGRHLATASTTLAGFVGRLARTAATASAAATNGGLAVDAFDLVRVSS